MWRILTVCLLAVSLVVASQEGAKQRVEDQDRIIVLEVEPNTSRNSKDKRSPQHGSSQVVFGASPGQFIVRTNEPSEAAQPEVTPEQLRLLEQLVEQQQVGQPVSQSGLQQLLIARNPDPSAIQFSSTQEQPPPRRRPPPSPQAQLQQLYFNQQFQQQIPLRPRILRPIPRPIAPSVGDFPGLPLSSQAHNLHEARLRASLAGNDPNLAVQALNQQQGSVVNTYDQQLLQLATAAQGRLVQAQALPQQAAQVQYVPQQQTAHTINSQVGYDPDRQVSASQDNLSSRQASTPQQLVSPELVKLSRRPAPPQQYLRETTQPVAERTVVQNLQRQQSSEPTIYLSSLSGQETPSASQDNDIISQFLLRQGHSLFHSSTPSPDVLAEDGIKSSTSLPTTESRSSIYVTQTSNLNTPQGPSRLNVEEIGPVQEDSGTPLPVVHLPTPKGQRPLSQSELQALIDAGFKITPVSESSPRSVAPEFYQTTTKRQRSYVTQAPLRSNQLSYQSRQKELEVTNRQETLALDVKDKRAKRVGINSRTQIYGMKKMTLYSISDVLGLKIPVKVFRFLASKS